MGSWGPPPFHRPPATEQPGGHFLGRLCLQQHRRVRPAVPPQHLVPCGGEHQCEQPFTSAVNQGFWKGLLFGLILFFVWVGSMQSAGIEVPFATLNRSLWHAGHEGLQMACRCTKILSPAPCGCRGWGCFWPRSRRTTSGPCNFIVRPDPFHFVI